MMPNGPPRFNLSIQQPGNEVSFCWVDKVDPAIWRLVYRRILRTYIHELASSHIQDRMIAEVAQFLSHLTQSGQIAPWPERWQFTKHADSSYLNVDGFTTGCLLTVVRAGKDLRPKKTGGIFLGWVDHQTCMVYIDGVPEEVEADSIEPVG